MKSGEPKNQRKFSNDEVLNSMIDSAKNSILEPIDDQKKKLSSMTLLSTAFFFLGGIISCPHVPLMVSKIDDFDIFFENYRYKFLISTPNYLAYPLTYVVLIGLNRSLPIKSKIIVSIALAVLFLSLTLIPTMFIPNTFISFVFMMSCYFLAFSLFTCAQGYILAILSGYENSLTVIYFIGQSSFGIVLNPIKLYFLSIKITFAQEIFFIIGLLVFLYVLFLISFALMEKNGNLKDLENKKFAKAKEYNYSQTFKEIKYELLSLFSIMVVTAIVYPGITFSVHPITLIEKKTFLISMSFAISVSFVFGRLASSYLFNHLLINVNQVIGYFVMIYFLVVYFFQLNLEYEGLCFTSMWLVCFLIYRESHGVTFLMMQSGKRANEINKEAAGQLMSNAFNFSRGVGSIISIVCSFLPKFGNI